MRITTISQWCYFKETYDLSCWSKFMRWWGAMMGTVQNTCAEHQEKPCVLWLISYTDLTTLPHSIEWLDVATDLQLLQFTGSVLLMVLVFMGKKFYTPHYSTAMCLCVFKEPLFTPQISANDILLQLQDSTCIWTS